MVEQAQKRCMACMAPVEGQQTECPVCKQRLDRKNPTGSLAAGTLLQEQYLIGAVLRSNELTTVYIGLDIQKDQRVYIEEFFPSAFAVRSPEDGMITVESYNLARYKTLFSDIVDRWKRLAGVENRALFRIRELFPANNTVYCVSAYLPYISLEEYLRKRGGPLGWEEVKSLMMPVLSLLSQLHNAGIFHCGISPETLVVDKKQRLKLIGFSLPELRTAGTDISAELYSGFSAPEQYDKSMWQGEWTDIYSLGAVISYMMTGKVPPWSTQRRKKDTMRALSVLQPGAPMNVSDAVTKAMALNKDDRFVSVDQLTAALLEKSISNTAVFRPAEQVRTQPSELQPETAATFSERRLLILSAAMNVGLLAVLIIVCIVFFRSDSMVDPEPEQNAVMTYNLIGMNYEMFCEKNEDSDLIMETVYEYNEQVPEGIVFAQSPQFGEILADGQSVTISVSKGSRYIVMPALEGCSEAYAMRLLEERGLKWIREESTAIDVPLGTVICNISPGTRLTADDIVTITVRIAGAEE